MYPPKYHLNKDKQKMISVIQKYPLAMLVSVIDNTPIITHVPLIYNSETGKMVGHIDKNNPHCVALQNNQEITLIFKGPNCYISPSVYTTKQLPTWNYIVVHLSGKVTAISDTIRAKQTMVAMAHFLESPDHKYVLSIDDPKMERVINYIHAFEIEITHWEGKFKLSQDKCVQDQENAKQELLKKSCEDITGFIDEI